MSLLLDRFGGAFRSALLQAEEREQVLEAIRASLEDTVSERTPALTVALEDVQRRADEQAALLLKICSSATSSGR